MRPGRILKMAILFWSSLIAGLSPKIHEQYWVVVPCLLSQWVKEGHVLLSPFYSSVTCDDSLRTWQCRALSCCDLAAVASTVYSAARKEGRIDVP